jgi:hypothetical protein
MGDVTVIWIARGESRDASRYGTASSVVAADDERSG